MIELRLGQLSEVSVLRNVLLALKFQIRLVFLELLQDCGRLSVASDPSRRPAVLNTDNELLANCLEDRGNDILHAFGQAQETALNILVVVFQHLVEFQEELDLLLHGRHPAEVKLEEQKEGQDAFASDHDVLVLE